jgi:heat-inducible transcriptional repressor
VTASRSVRACWRGSSPHTSAGRIPTPKGYRFFVDTLLTVRDLDRDEIRRVKEQLHADETDEDLIESASEVLSELTRMAGVVLMPRRDHHVLRHVEFLPLSGRRVLAILVVDESQVVNRILHPKRDYTREELQEVANYINWSFSGLDVAVVRDKLLEEMLQTRESVYHHMRAAIEMAGDAFPDDAKESDYVVAGKTNLMGFSELSDIRKLRQLFDAFDRKRDIVHLLDECMRSPGIQIFIGEESGYEPLDGCSIVTSTYQSTDGIVGVLGVIGPTRMAYQDVIPIVDMTAKLIGSVLKHRI